MKAIFPPEKAMVWVPRAMGMTFKMGGTPWSPPPFDYKRPIALLAGDDDCGHLVRIAQSVVMLQSEEWMFNQVADWETTLGVEVHYLRSIINGDSGRPTDEISVGMARHLLRQILQGMANKKEAPAE